RSPTPWSTDRRRARRRRPTNKAIWFALVALNSISNLFGYEFSAFGFRLRIVYPPSAIAPTSHPDSPHTGGTRPDIARQRRHRSCNSNAVRTSRRRPPRLSHSTPRLPAIQLLKR